MAESLQIAARFDDFEAFKHALETLKESRVRRYEAYGPTNLKEIENLMPGKGSRVRVWATSGAIVGLAAFWIMCVFTALIYSLYVGGKPPVSNVPYIIPAYEGTILMGSIGAFFAGLMYAFMGLHELPSNYNPRFSQDSYGIEVYGKHRDRERYASLLRDAGAVEVNEFD